MNDRFLSRGKREDNGKWITGYYVKIPNQSDKLNKEYHVIFELDGQVNYVIPETVGGCTSLTDKNGKKIFEGDILRHDKGDLHEVVFEQRNGHAYFGLTINELETWDFDLDFLRQLEIVGNIHDNPNLKLIEGQNET